MLLPAFFVHVDGATGAVIDMGSGVFFTDRALHKLESSPLNYSEAVATP